MSWALLFGLVLALGFALLASLKRRHDLRRMRQTVATRAEVIRQGGAEAQLQHPVIDLSRCLGCGTCVQVCPEEGVLDLVHGQAVVVNGARCVGVSACERECPVDAITVTLSNVATRNDIPALTDDLEAVGSPGLFLAGEVTAHALVKTAVAHGTAVAAEVARRCAGQRTDPQVYDLCVVGAGPAGIACMLEAERQGLRAVCLEQEAEIGGTVARYPRRKLVLTQPIDLPLHGRLPKRSYTKEDLIELWHGLVEAHDLQIETGATLTDLSRDGDGNYAVTTPGGTITARHVCLALGRRGVPTRLGVPGEELTKVAYGLIDARSYQNRRIAIVGGGDSAVETAVSLAEQPGNEVTMLYRKAGFYRPKAENMRRLQRCIDEGHVTARFGAVVTGVFADRIEFTNQDGEPAGHRGVSTLAAVECLPNDDLFVMIGGTPAIDLLERCGVSFDPSLRDVPPPVVERGTGLAGALAWGFGLALVALGFVLWNLDYYAGSAVERTTHPSHALLRPGLGVGLWLGIAAATLIVVNLLYLVRRGAWGGFRVGSLKAWMTSHVATGILALLCALLHGAMSPENSPGGRALWALVVLLVTGAIGRYFYAYVPRAANGRELELTEIENRLQRLGDAWGEGQAEFTAKAQEEVRQLVEKRQWHGSFVGRVFALLGVQLDLRRTLRRLSRLGDAEGIPDEHLQHTLRLTREAHRTALMVAHYEDLRGVLSTWRWLHRWVAALLVLLVVVHIVHALIYGAFAHGGPR